MEAVEEAVLPMGSADERAEDQGVTPEVGTELVTLVGIP